MDLAANEISIYDKLSETVDLVRQTGHQCGMSEKAIEKFIRQLLEKNEPQRGPPQYPLLIAVYKLISTRASAFWSEQLALTRSSHSAGVLAHYQEVYARE
uniref:cDNA sequence BC004004 n=1 Tax=Mus musculus TaxID=10090 RepID=A0A3Q4EGQ4_MOUSE